MIILIFKKKQGQETNKYVKVLLICENKTDFVSPLILGYGSLWYKNKT